MKSIMVKPLSKAQMRAMKNEQKVRLKRADEMSGGSVLIVYPHNYNILTKSFDKNKGVQLNLSKEEVEANMENISGEGIFGKKFDKFAKKLVGSKTYSKVSETLKKPALEVVKRGSQIAKPVLTTALSSIGVPAPLVSKAVDLTERIATWYIEDPTKYQRNPKEALLQDVKEEAQDTLKSSLGMGLYARGGEIMSHHKGGDRVGFVNPNFMLRTTTPDIYYKMSYGKGLYV